ncbi:hypothetical protein [Geminocystis herdmanii]|uniref:hypothetical protein n=1 Tax=Geminocystis herdmanii TaxID=669359 RepID=UPI000345F19C|nr:hypothetical protein [Geminocystis herdmanii]
MFNENTNLKSLLEKPINRIIIAVGAIALFLIILIWIIATLYNVDTPPVCLSVTEGCNPLDIQEVSGNSHPILISPFPVSLISGGLSTVALGVLIGVGFLELPIVFALAGGVAFASLTYTTLQVLY